jgi:hypothetical protein
MAAVPSVRWRTSWSDFSEIPSSRAISVTVGAKALLLRRNARR